MNNPAPTPDEIAERTIDFIEDLGHPLEPWQATTLRAMLTYPVGTRFVVSPPPQHEEVATYGGDKLPPNPKPCHCKTIDDSKYGYDWCCANCGLRHKAPN